MDTHLECVIFSIATVDTRTHLNVTSYFIKESRDTWADDPLTYKGISLPIPDEL